MKRVLLFLSVLTFISFTSCDNAEEEPIPEPSALALDLQNGYWETQFTSGDISVLKFNESTAISYWVEGNPLCIVDINTQNYTLEGNLLTLPSSENTLIIEIQDDVLTLLDEVDQMMIEFNRKSSLDYPDC